MAIERIIQKVIQSIQKLDQTLFEKGEILQTCKKKSRWTALLFVSYSYKVHNSLVCLYIYRCYSGKIMITLYDCIKERLWKYR